MTQTFTVPIDLLPPLLQEFERLVGLQATMTLVQKWGGLRVYFPTQSASPKITPMPQSLASRHF